MIWAHDMLSANHFSAATSGGLVKALRTSARQNSLSPMTPKMPRTFRKSRNNASKCTTAEIIEGSTLRDRLPAGDTLTLYTHTLCPYAQRSFSTLLCKQVSHDTVHIDLANKPSWYANVNGRGLVPAVEYQGQVHTESIDICRSAMVSRLCRWLDDTFDGPDLKSNDLQTDKLIAGCSAFVSAGLDFLAGTTGRSWGIGTRQSKAQQGTFQQQLDKFHAQLGASGGPFLLGQEVSLADLIYMPFMERFALALPEFANFSVAEACNGGIGSWLTAMQNLQCWQTAAADPQLLLQAFRKHRSLDFFDFDTYTATQLHPHLQARDAAV